MLSPTQKIGQRGEDQALHFLAKHGLALIERNFNCKQGEIDLIMRDQDFIVFVEVRYRKLASHGDPLDSITKAKRRRVMKAATFYLLKHELYDLVPCRFDVVAFNSDNQDVNWIKDAFQVQ